MKKLFIVSLMVLSLVFGGQAFACEGADCSAEGNFDIGTFAIGGGIDADGALIPNGAAGGISAAAGFGIGDAEGSFKSKWGISFGSARGQLNSVGGGMTDTKAYTFNQPGGSDPYDLAIGVGSQSDSVARTGGYLGIGAEGFAYSAGGIAGLAGQGSLNGSILTGSPLPVWNSKGVTGAVAGQGSVGGFVGAAATGLYGDAQVGADITMNGFTEADSYRAVNFIPGGHIEYMTSYGHAETQVNSYGFADDYAFATGFVEGGWIAAGGVATGTIQTVEGGMAKAHAIGAYAGAGELGCTFNGVADGYSKTSTTTLNGYNGSIMTSSAGMSVSNSPVQQVVDVR